MTETELPDPYAYSPNVPTNIVRPIFQLLGTDWSCWVDAASWPNPETMWNLDLWDKYLEGWE